jgi:hypothetical protein
LKPFLIIFFSVSLFAEVGKISAIKNDVFLERELKKISAFKGFLLREKDTIYTDLIGKAQIKFKDNTIVRIGRNAIFKIEKYLFDKTKKSELQLKVENGFFSVVTGEIGKVAKDRFKFKTNRGITGIRGTHFQGFIDGNDNSEKIACLRGEITFETTGKFFEISAGEMLEIRDGIELKVRKIESKDLKSMENGISEISNLNLQVENLSTEKDSDIKYSEYQKLTQKINEFYHAEASKYYFKTPILWSLDGFTEMAIYTENEIEIPEDAPLNEKIEIIKSGIPYDIAISRNEILNDEAIENYIPKYDFWNGKNENGKIAKYNGNIVFASQVSYQPNPDLQLESDLEKETILSDEVAVNGLNKEINLQTDYLNGFVSGNFEYKNGEIYFSNSGTGSLEAESFLFYGNNILYKNQEILDSENIFIGVQNSGYSGENFQTLSAEMSICLDDFETCKNYNLENEPFTSLLSGFIAEKVSETEVYKKEIGSDEDFSWGYWAYQFDDEDEKIRGAWVDTDLERIAKENILKIATASYSGEIYGTIENSLQQKTATKIENGKFHFDFDFTNKIMNGNLEFNQYSLQFQAKNQILFEEDSENDFEFKKSYSTSVVNMEIKEAPQFFLKNGDDPVYLQGSGNLYGENGENIGGGFTAGFQNGDTAIATFKGEKE